MAKVIDESIKKQLSKRMDFFWVTCKSVWIKQKSLLV